MASTPIASFRNASIRQLRPINSDFKYYFIQDRFKNNGNQSFGDTSAYLKNVNWKLFPQQNWLFYGPNGSGKSTLASAIRGNDAYFVGNEGEFSLASDLFGMKHWFGFVSFSQNQTIMQLAEKLEDFSEYNGVAREDLTVGGTLLSSTAAKQSKKIQNEIQQLIDLFMLSGSIGSKRFLERHLISLSTGELRKVLLISSLVGTSKVLVLDEVFDGLDVDSRKNFATYLNRRYSLSNKKSMDTNKRQYQHGGNDIDKTKKKNNLLFETSEIQNLNEIDKSELPLQQLIVISHRLEECQLLHDTLTHALEFNGNGGVGYQGPINSFLDLYRQKNKHNTSNMTTLKGNHDKTIEKALMFWKKKKAEQKKEEIFIKFDGISCTKGDRKILSNISWEVKSGDKWLVSGPNGAGKSLLLGLITGENLARYENFDKIKIFGRGVLDTEPPAESRTFGTLTTNLHSVAGNLHIGCVDVASSELHRMHSQNPLRFGLKNKSDEEIDKIFKEVATSWLSLLGFPKDVMEVDQSGRIFSQLSQGQQRIVLLAMLLSVGHDLLILDEPFHGLSVQARKILKDLLEAVYSHEYTQDSHHALILVTHQDDEIPKFGSGSVKQLKISKQL